jgi:hypothetical protein
MGIDHIGNKGPPPAPRPDPTGGRVAGPAFEAPPPVAGVTPPPSTEPVGPALERFRAGEVDLSGYLDLKVNEATEHLAALPPTQLAAIRATLRERMATDPSLVDLVRTATGHAPAPPDDE